MLVYQKQNAEQYNTAAFDTFIYAYIT